jgi:hypothetical protein
MVGHPKHEWEVKRRFIQFPLHLSEETQKTDDN